MGAAGLDGVMAADRGAVRAVVPRGAVGMVLGCVALRGHFRTPGLGGGGRGAERQRRAKGDDGKKQTEGAEHAVVFLGGGQRRG
jgi:hypothetical protein